MAIKNRLFFDSSFFCSVKNQNDTNYTAAITLFHKIQNITIEPYTGTHILLESATVISQQVGKEKAVEVIDELRSGSFQLIHPTNELLLSAEELFKKILSKNISYADCISFAIMKKLHINWVLSFDIHFKKQGFKRIGIDGSPK